MQKANAGRTGLAGKNGYAVRPNYRSVASLSWRDIGDDIVAGLVTTVTEAGAAVMLSVTSDGGALAITVLDGDSKVKEYPRSETEVHNFALWLKDEYFPLPLPTTKKS